MLGFNKHLQYILKMCDLENCLSNSGLTLKVMKNSQCCKIMYKLMFTNLNYFKLHF